MLLLLIIFIFSLGPVLHVNGVNTNIPLPWYIIQKFPIIRSALPTRFTMYISLIIALIVGLWLSEKKLNNFNYYFKYLIVTIGIIVILPNINAFNWNNISTPKVFTKNYIKTNSNSAVLVLPFNSLGNSMYYQYVDNMSFMLNSGYIGFVSNTFLSNPLFTSFYSGKIIPNFRQEIINYCKKYKVSLIVYTSETNINLVSELNNLHWKTKTVGNSKILTVPEY